MMLRGSPPPASKPLSTTSIIVTASAAIIAFVALIWLALVSPRGVPGIGYRYVNAQFGSAGNVPISTEVRIAGLNVGQVVGANLQRGVATLRLQLRPGTEQIHRDARARIDLKGVLGGKYIDLSPGRSGPALTDNATIPPSRTSTAVDLLDALQELDAPHRADLRALLDGLGGGFADRGADVNAMLHAAAPTLSDLESVANAALARPGAAARLFPSLNSFAAAWDPVRGDLAAGFRPEARAVNTFAAQSPDIQRALDVAPSSLEQARGGLTAATPLLDEVAGLARAAIRFTEPAPDALRATTALLHDAPAALSRTARLLRTLQPAVSPVIRMLTSVDPIAPPATRALSTSLPPLVELGSRPCDLASFTHNWRSMIGFGVPSGSGSLASADGLGYLNSVRLILALPPAPDTLGLDSSPSNIPSDPYPAACAAAGEKR